MDDCSRYTWVYLVKHKSQTQPTLEQFCTIVETQFLKKVKTIRTDNDIEFIMFDFFVKKGILHQLVVLKLHSKMSLWKESINTS